MFQKSVKTAMGADLNGPDSHRKKPEMSKTRTN